MKRSRLFHSKLNISLMAKTLTSFLRVICLKHPVITGLTWFQKLIIIGSFVNSVFIFIVDPLSTLFSATADIGYVHSAYTYRYWYTRPAFQKYRRTYKSLEVSNLFNSLLNFERSLIHASISWCKFQACPWGLFFCFIPFRSSSCLSHPMELLSKYNSIKVN